MDIAIATGGVGVQSLGLFDAAKILAKRDAVGTRGKTQDFGCGKEPEPLTADMCVGGWKGGGCWESERERLYRFGG